MQLLLLLQHSGLHSRDQNRLVSLQVMTYYDDEKILFEKPTSCTIINKSMNDALWETSLLILVATLYA